MKVRYLAAVALLAAGVAGAGESTYPSRPIRFVCPYAPGGNCDIFTRTIGRKLGDALGQPVVVDNRGGANGGIGTALVAKSAGDGYTLLMGNSGPMTINPVLYDSVSYDPI